MARRLVVKRSSKKGKPPGSLVHIGAPSDAPAHLRLIRYDQHALHDQPLNAIQALPDLKQDQVTWLNIDGVHQGAVIEALGERFKLHPLALEDVLNTDQRAKVDEYQGYLYLVMRMLRFDPVSQQIQSEQLSLVLGDNYVLSLQERPGDVFDSVRERLQAGRRIRFLQADYLAYALLDAVVDHYFAVLEHLGEAIENLEDELISNPTPQTLGRIHHFKREMLLLRKSVWPLREVLLRLSRDDSSLIKPETRLFLRDVYDHSIHVMDTIDTLRELLVGMLDLYLSSVSHKMNQVMKVLTIIATLFMPLTFLAGVYGMNFEYMPELAWPWAYPAVLLLMLAIAGGLLWAFRRRGWL